MKFTTLLAVTLASYTLAAPVGTTSPDTSTISTRLLPLDFTPRIGVTVPSSSKHFPRALSDRIRRASKNHDSVLKLMNFIARRVKDECGYINTAIQAAQYEGLVDEAVVTTARTMNHIRTLLSNTVSYLDNTPNMEFTQEERQRIAKDVYIITSEFFKTTKDYVETLGGASGGRSLSRAAHMLTDMLDNIVSVDPEVSFELSHRLTPIFSGKVGRDEDDLLDVVMGSVTRFLSSIKVEASATAYNGSEDCSSNQNEELR